ncbi:hypothetical protein ANO11243_092840 [Dothideomycetidae sp. 11243]|nr:hypothetical protein ANO11243_092840 [fungal sp. No.11243]
MANGPDTMTEREMLLDLFHDEVSQAMLKSSLRSVDLLLAILVMVQCFSTYLQRADSLRWTKHMSTYLKELEAQAECSGDLFLVYQVRLQLVLERLSVHNWVDWNFEDVTQPDLPPAFYVPGLMADLDRAIAQKPAALENRGETHAVSLDLYITDSLSPVFVNLHQHSIELVVADKILSTYTEGDSLHDHRRRKHLLNCVVTARALLDMFSTVGAAQYVRLPFTMRCPLTHCMSVFFRILASGDTFDDIMTKADIKDVLDALIDGLDQTTEDLQLEGNDHIYARHREFWWCVRSHWSPILAGDEDVMTYEEPHITDLFLFEEELFNLDYF